MEKGGYLRRTEGHERQKKVEIQSSPNSLERMYSSKTVTDKPEGKGRKYLMTLMERR